MRPAQTNYYTSFDPRSVRNCIIWVDAADSRTITLSGSTVVSILDKSSNAYVFSNSSGFTYNVTKFNTMYPSFYSTAASAALGSNISPVFSTASTGPYSVFAVGQAIGTASVKTIYDTGTNGTRGRYLSNVSTGHRAAMIAAGGEISSSNNASTTFVNTFIARGAITPGSSVFLNGVLQASGLISGATGSGGIRLGQAQGSTTEGFVGHLCEIIVYRADVTLTNEHQTIEGYLAHKWGIQSVLPSTHPFRNTPPFRRPFIPTDIITPYEYWFDAADRTTISSNGTALVTLSNKGSITGSNLTVNSGTITTGVVTQQNGSNLLGMSAGVGGFTTTFSNQVRTNFFALRPLVNTTTTSVVFLTQGSDNVTPGPDRILFDSTNGFRPTERSGASLRMSSTVTNQSNIFGIWTFRNASTTASNRIAINGVAQTFEVANSIAANYITTSRTTTVGSNMDFGEFISYNSQLTESETLLLEGYLGWKWGLLSSFPVTHPYKFIRPTTNMFISPALFSNCQVWLDAADQSSLTFGGSSTVSAWRDKSGNNRTVTIVGSPLYTKIPQFNSVGVISFNGSSDSVTVAYSVGQPFTIYAVTAQYDPPSSYRDYSFVFGATTATGARLYYNLFSADQLIMSSGIDVDTGIVFVSGKPIMYGAFYSGATSFFSFNGTVTSNINPGTAGLSNILLAGTSTEPLNTAASFGEIIVYNRSLSFSERNQIEGYLAWKWNLQLPQSHPYKNIKP